jgi:hypothetical protein
MIFSEVKRGRRAWTLIHARWPEYLRFLNLDLASVREEVLRVIAGGVLGAVGGSLFGSFLSVAAIVTAWDTGHRVLVAWLVCLVWAAIAMAASTYARRALQGPLPFSRVTAELLRDLAQLERDK